MALTPVCDLFVLCGETSGDAYGAAIVSALREAHPELAVAAMGGEHLRRAGAEIDQSIEGLAVMGLGPVLARLPEFIRLGMRVADLVRTRRPKVVLTVDYPGFNMRLLRRIADLRRDGTRFVHVVAPQVWAWKPRRAKAIAATVDRLLCFFPFEPPLFNRFADRTFSGFPGCQAEFVGHPLVDLMAEPRDPAAIEGQAGLAPGQPFLLLAPGSRPKEIAALLPVYHQAAELVQARIPGIGVAVSRLPDLPLELYRRATHLPLVDGRYRDLLVRAHVAVIASGTATLEAALAGTPHVIAYRTDRLTAAVARRVILTDHVGLPNLVAGARVVPEVLQDQLNPERLAAHVLALWQGARRARCLADLADVRQRLGGGGAMARMAAVVDAELRRGERRDTGAFAPGSVTRSRTETLEKT